MLDRNLRIPFPPSQPSGRGPGSAQGAETQQRFTGFLRRHRQEDTPDKVAKLRKAPSRGRIEGDFVMSNFIKMLNDESGASAAEYALILAIIGSAIALAAIGLGNAISNRLSTTSTCIESKNASQYTANCQ